MRPVKNGGRVQNFVYDKNGRLISETDTADNSTISYTYEHVIIGTRKEKPVDTGVSELVPFSFS